MEKIEKSINSYVFFKIINPVTSSAGQYNHPLQSYVRFYDYKFEILPKHVIYVK